MEMMAVVLNETSSETLLKLKFCVKCLEAANGHTEDVAEPSTDWYTWFRWDEGE